MTLNNKQNEDPMMLDQPDQPDQPQKTNWESEQSNEEIDDDLTFLLSIDSEDFHKIIK